MQFNWKTKTQAYPGTKKPRFTDGQMEAVLDDLVERGGRVESAMRRVPSLTKQLKHETDRSVARQQRLYRR